MVGVQGKSCGKAFYPDWVSEVPNKQRNILETETESYFLAVAFIFTFRIIVSVQRNFSQFLVLADTNENRDVALGSIERSEKSREKTPLNVNNFLTKLP